MPFADKNIPLFLLVEPGSQITNSGNEILSSGYLFISPNMRRSIIFVTHIIGLIVGLIVGLVVTLLGEKNLQSSFWAQEPVTCKVHLLQEEERQHLSCQETVSHTGLQEEIDETNIATLDILGLFA
jgi:hypothetical protein